MGTLQLNLMQYMQENAERDVYVKELMKEFRSSSSSIFNALRVLRKEEKLPGLIKKTKSGPFYYSPNRYVQEELSDPLATDKLLFELIRTTSRGHMLLEDENGDLYLAKKLSDN